MKTTFISTSAISAATRASIMKVQQQLSDAQKEMSTGRYADVGKVLGYNTGQVISLRQQHTRLQTIVDTNKTVSSRMEVTQNALQSLIDNAQAFVKQLISSRNGSATSSVAQTDAQTGLNTFIDTMNTTYAGGYVFAGVNTDAKPIAGYYTTPASASQQSVGNAFLAQFGIAQSDPAAQNITAANMQTFLDNSFSALFADPAWSADWSSASNQNIRNRISSNELIETSVSANEDAFRKLAKAYSMVADLGVTNLSDATFQKVADVAIGEATSAIEQLGGLQSRVGVAQQRVTDASERLSLQVDILNNQVTSLEGVDPNEAASRVTALMTQLESSYSLTGRLMKLSILDYI
jgi:flagellar hook-associated protein 3 FlgL